MSHTFTQTGSLVCNEISSLHRMVIQMLYELFHPTTPATTRLRLPRDLFHMKQINFGSYKTSRSETKQSNQFLSFGFYNLLCIAINAV